MSSPARWAWVDVDLGAIAANVAYLKACASPAELWAVVKADAYGHGAVAVAPVALEAGASGLCVALVEEALELREAGLDGRILILSEQPSTGLEAAAAARVELTVASDEGIDAAASAARRAGTRVAVHLKVDTGMARVGCEPAAAAKLAAKIVATPALSLAGVSTHLACADDPDSAVTEVQLRAFRSAVRSIRAAGVDPGLLHAANSAGLLAFPEARFDAVRSGIAVYGLRPGPGLSSLCSPLAPALGLAARVTSVRRVDPGAGVGYGHRFRATAPTTVVTVPLGYADGVPRRAGNGRAVVLLGGRRRPIVGSVSMDQLMVDAGSEGACIGDEVLLIGSQGNESIGAGTWADLLETIDYEVVTALRGRLPRRYLHLESS